MRNTLIALVALGILSSAARAEVRGWTAAGQPIAITSTIPATAAIIVVSRPTAAEGAIVAALDAASKRGAAGTWVADRKITGPTGAIVVGSWHRKAGR